MPSEGECKRYFANTTNGLKGPQKYINLLTPLQVSLVIRGGYVPYKSQTENTKTKSILGPN
jgi:hypothetical protein